MKQDNISFDEKMHASAVNFLLSKKENDAALALLSCSIDLEQKDYRSNVTGYNLYLTGPRYTYEILIDTEHEITNKIKYAFNAVLPAEDYIYGITPHASIIDVEPNWKEQMIEIALAKEVHNQGIEIKDRTTVIWKKLRFRSETEKKIAEALERANVLFLPNCLGRLNTEEGRKTKEADFLICDNSKWGVLEVDGEPYHPASRTTEDHKRDRAFLSHGIPIVQHYDAKECYYQPDKVVANFLSLLR